MTLEILKEISLEYSLEGLMLKLSSNTLTTWCKELTHWERPWCWEGLKAGREGDNRGWVGWMTSPTQRTWVWTSSQTWWWTGKPGVLQSMASQRVGHNWVTELNWKLYTTSGFRDFKHFLFVILPISVQFSHSVVSDSLPPHESQHIRPPCPSPTPGVYPNSCAFSQGCHPAISSSVVPFSSCP